MRTRSVLIPLTSILLGGLTPRGAHGQVATASVAAPVATSTAAAEAPSVEAPSAEAPSAEAPGVVAPAATSSAAPSPASKGKSGLFGRVTDAKNGEALIEATVKVVKGGKGQAMTDVEGEYTLALPPGTYELRVFYEVYKPQRLEVVVPQGAPRRLDVALGADAGAIQEVVVEAKVDKRREGVALEQRKQAAVVQDTLSAQEVSRAGDSSAATAVRRVVGTTIRDGRYVEIRGLGDRYTPTLMNGVPLPSLDPDNPSAPLDILPSSVLSSLNVVKTHRSELPGEFAGGALMLSTNDFPRQLEARVRLTGGLNSVSSFVSAWGGRGGGLDYLGFDDGSRALPSGVPTDKAMTALNGGMTREEVLAAGRTFANTWGGGTSALGPNGGLSGSLGTTFDLGGGKKLGLLGSLSFSNQQTYADITLQNTNNTAAPGQSSLIEPLGPALRNERRESSAMLGGMLTGGLELGRNDSVNLVALYAHHGVDRSFLQTGFSESLMEDLRRTRSQLIERSLLFTQLTGEHRLPKVGNLKLSWQGNLSLTGNDEPDTRDVTYRLPNPDRQVFVNQTGSGERYWLTLGDRTFGASAKAELPLGDHKVWVGGFFQRQGRNFGLRRFRYNQVPSVSPAALAQAPELLFAADNLGTVMTLDERTLANDAYDASRTIIAGHVGAEWVPLDALKVVAGLRVEAANQTVTSGSRYSVDSNVPAPVDRSELGLLPSLNASWALDRETNLRLGYSLTLARPFLRELAPFAYFDYTRRRTTSGNPNLIETRIHNLDLRWEWFLGDNELLAASVFGKYFREPIERVILGSAQGEVGFQNAEAALLGGTELEARIGLGRFTDALADFRVGANLALIASQVTLSAANLGSTTSKERALQGQAPYIVNVSAGWGRKDWGTDVNVLLNVVGPRISEVGFDGLLDVYQQPVPLLDVSVSQRLVDTLSIRLAMLNLLDAVDVDKMATVETYRFRRGVSGTLALEWVP